MWHVCLPVTQHVSLFSEQISQKRKKYLDSLMAIWIAKRCRPLGIVESDTELQDVLLAVSGGAYRGPCRETVMKRTTELSVEVSCAW